MVREQFIVAWKEKESKTITEENMATVLISGNHVCKACATVKSFSAMPLFIDHLTQSHREAIADGKDMQTIARQMRKDAQVLEECGVEVVALATEAYKREKQAKKVRK